MKKRLLSMFLVAMLMPFVMLAQANDVTTITQTEIGCNSYTWTVNGTTYTTSGVYSTVLNDTVFILDLQLGYNDTTTVVEPVTAGCSYVWGDTTITESGEYTQAFTSAEGCDSVVIMTFNITETATMTVSDTVCESTVFNGTTYESSTVIVVDTIINECPTEYTLNLTVIEPREIHRYDSVVACDRYLFTFITGTANFIATSNMDTTTNTLSHRNAAMENKFHPRTKEQCFDSTYHLNITINNSSYFKDDVVACDMAEYLITYIADNGRQRDSIFKYIYNTTDTIKRVTKNVLGCDSNVVLNVTVNRSPVITISGSTSVQPGESVTLTATSDQSNMSWEWTWEQNDTVRTSTDDNIPVNNITENTDVVLNGVNTVTNCASETSVTILCNVGIDEAEAQQVVIYPNPATAFVNIESAHAISSISVYNTVGQLVYTAGTQGTKATMDVSSYANGTYMMRMVLANGSEVVRTMVVKK